jgi:hypothetical protein
MFIIFFCYERCIEIWSKRNQSQRRHDLRGKPLQCEGEKPRAPAGNNLTISRVWGYTHVTAYKRIKSPRNPSKGIYTVPLRSGPSLRRRASASLRQKPGLYPGVNLEQLQHLSGYSINLKWCIQAKIGSSTWACNAWWAEYHNAELVLNNSNHLYFGNADQNKLFPK